MKKSIFYRFSIVLFFFTILSFSLQAQHTVEGTVIEAETGTSIPGASVVEVGTGGTNGTITDLDGKFFLTVVSDTATLRVSYIGFQTQNVPVNGRAKVDVALEIESVGMEEVVVIGYGTQKKKVVTGAISSMSSEEINSKPVLRVEQAMQGQTAGVQVTNLSGQPGEAPTVRIRGTGTTGNSEPLYIVDGMAVGGIEYLNPGDIESIDVLKDAASSAIYGARAANGVVLITTKSGQKGSGMQVNYSGYYGIQNPTHTVEALNAEQYRELMNEGAANANLDEPFDLNELPKHNTNWQEHLFVKNAPMTNHDFRVNGGNEKSSYASSLSYFSQEGIIGGNKSKFERYTARLNATHQVNKRFNFGTNISYAHTSSRGIASNASFNSAYSSALNLDPLTPLYEDDPDELNDYPYSDEPVLEDSEGRVYGISDYVGAEIVNPIALMEIQTGETRVDKLVGNVFGELEIIQGLKFRTSAGIDLAYVLNDSYRPLFYLNGAQLNDDRTSVSKNIDRYHTWQSENTLNYTKKIGYHNFSILAGMTARKSNFENLSGFNADVPVYDPDNVYLNMAKDTVWTAYGGASHSALLSQFGRITYDYQSKYAVTAIIRRDGSSRFGSNNRYGIFPSLGVSWAISDEEFMPDLGPIELLKLRASWGINGNQEIGDYQFISVIDRSRGYIFGGGRVIGASPAYIQNADLRWEESEQIDIAIDLNAYQNRLVATIDFYQKTTNGLLERVPIPAHVGNDAPFDNVGSVENKGVEISVDWRQSVNDLYYSFGINGAYNKNTMTEIGNEEGVLPGATWAVAGAVTRAEEGLPIAYFWGYQTDGLFQNEAEVFKHIGSTGEVLQPNAKPGDVRFVDVNGDGELDADDRTMIGNPTPDWTFGMNANFEYKQFDFSFLLTGTYGNDVFNGTQRQDLRYTNRTTKILDRWTGPGTSEEIPRYTWSDINNNYRISDLYIEDGSYLRVKNVQLGYSLPQNIIKRIGSVKWRFYVSAENLYTLTNYTGADPEIGAMSSFDIGIDRGVYPQARTIRFGTSLTF
jgi:TonB-linked SusC/RagA family outer membrane protein